MKTNDGRRWRPDCAARSLLLAGLALLLGACRPAPVASYQGYFEGDYVYVAAPLAGRLERLAVTKGGQVAAGDPLFVLERAAEQAAQREAAGRVAQAQARLADLHKGQRPSELAALDARLAQARAAAELSAIELRRTETLLATAVATASEFDRAKLTHERNEAAVAELAAQLETARLGGRADAVAAAEAEVEAAGAALARADWAVAQKEAVAPGAALVFDTLYREGEFVAAGSPVVSLLPPENIKVRFFVPEADVGTLRTGQPVRVAYSGGTEPLAGRISYVSPQPEFTPPVLYNRDNRAKLVFLVEALFDPEAARGLHPGQPADVIVER